MICPVPGTAKGAESSAAHALCGGARGPLAASAHKSGPHLSQIRKINKYSNAHYEYQNTAEFTLQNVAFSVTRRQILFCDAGAASVEISRSQPFSLRRGRRFHSAGIMVNDLFVSLIHNHSHSSLNTRCSIILLENLLLILKKLQAAGFKV